jgi:sugar phosphate isomerase/epimerase
MPARFDRRQLIADLGRVSLLGCIAPSLAAAAGGPGKPSEKLYDISLAEWSFHRALQSGAMSNLDFPGVARERFDIGAVEYVNTFFQDKATDFGYLRELEKRCLDAGVKSNLIMIDSEGDLGDADDAARASAVRKHLRWIAAASFLGCHSIRVNARGSGAPEEVKKRAADSLRQLGEYGDPYDIDVIVENHGGISSNGKWLAEVMRRANHPRVGTLPDFGNFDMDDGKTYDRYQGIAEMMPFAKAVSAKSYEFDERGEEVRIDYHRMLKIVVDAGYRGYLGIEYEGDKHSEDDGVRLTKALLERVRAELG